MNKAEKTTLLNWLSNNLPEQFKIIETNNELHMIAIENINIIKPLDNRIILERHYNEKSLTHLIMDLLCVPGEWVSETVSGKIVLHMEGNWFNVQKAIFDWLMIPERYYNFSKFFNREE